MIRLVKGDMFDSKCEVLVITVNCKGAMGKGIAKDAAQLYPELEARYKELCEAGVIKPGCPYMPSLPNLDKKFILFPTKDDWKDDSKLEWINRGLSKLGPKISQFKSVAIPPLGCGNGNLEFLQVFNLMLKHLEGKRCIIHIYPPK